MPAVMPPVALSLGISFRIKRTNQRRIKAQQKMPVLALWTDLSRVKRLGVHFNSELGQTDREMVFCTMFHCTLSLLSHILPVMNVSYECEFAV